MKQIKIGEWSRENYKKGTINDNILASDVQI